MSVATVLVAGEKLFAAGSFEKDLLEVGATAPLELRLIGPTLRIPGVQETAVYRWDFGGESAAEGQTVTKTFPAGRSETILTTSSALGDMVKAWAFEVSCPQGDVAPWSTRDMGILSFSGNARLEPQADGVALELCAGGASPDTRFFFVYQELSGNTGLVARLGALTRPRAGDNELNRSRVGLMLRSTLDPTEPFAAVFFEDKEEPLLRFYSRQNRGVRRRTIGSFPKEGWIRLARIGSDLIASTSPDGVVWEEVYRVTLELPETLYGGVTVNGRESSSNPYYPMSVTVEHLRVLTADDLTPSFVRGDCNNDGVVSGNVSDAAFLLNFNFLGGPKPACLAACDTNGNGTVLGRIEDAIYLFNYSFLGGPAPPAPFPLCGGGTALDAPIGCGIGSGNCP
jgi:hypothetical protein